MKQIIDSYEKLPLGLYLEILKINDDPGMDDLSRQCAIISILTGLKESDVLQLPLSDYAACAACLSFLSVDVPQPRRSIGKSITIGNRKYTLAQNPAKITTAQFVDFRTYAGTWKDGIRPVAELLSSLMVPEGKRYGEGYEIEDVQTDIRENMDTITAFALCAFFLTSWRRYLKASLFSLIGPLKRLKRKGKVTEAEALMTQWKTILTDLQQNGLGPITSWLLPHVRILRGTLSGTWDA